MKRELTQPLRGIVPPVVTPLTDCGQLDFAALEGLLEHLIAGGVHGLFILGTTGEGPVLPTELRRQLVRQTCQLVRERVPVYVGVTDSSQQDSVELSNFAADAGCEAVVAAPPYYFPLSQTDLVAYFSQLSERLPLPLVLYNMPALTKMHFAPESVRQLLDLESIVGLKDSSGDLEYFKTVIQTIKPRPDFSVMVGPEHLLAETLALGGDGGVAGGANICPHLFVDLYNAAMENKLAQVQEFDQKVKQLGEIYKIPPISIPAIVARIKAALSECRLCKPTMAPPFLAVPLEEIKQIRGILEKLGILERYRTTSHGSSSPSCLN